MITSHPNALAARRATADLPSDGWLTALLRPAGTLAGAFADTLAQSIDELSTTADMVVVDLEAAQIPDAKAVADLLRPPAARLASAGKCLLLLNLPEALVHAVQRADVPAVTLPAELILDGLVPALDDLLPAGDGRSSGDHQHHPGAAVGQCCWTRTLQALHS